MLMIINEWCSELSWITHFTSEHLEGLPYRLFKYYTLSRVGIIAIRYTLHILIFREKRVCASKSISNRKSKKVGLDHQPS